MKPAPFKLIALGLIALLISTYSKLSVAEEADTGASMTDIVSGVKNLCGGSGSDTSLEVTGNGEVSASKAVSLLVSGKVAGTVEFSNTEWDGIRAMRDKPEQYAQCVQTLTPVFIDKFSKKNLLK